MDYENIVIIDKKAKRIRYNMFRDVDKLPNNHPLIQLWDEMMKIPKWRLNKDFGGEMDKALDRIMERNHPDIFKSKEAKWYGNNRG